MIRVVPAPEPPDFKKLVSEPGERQLLELIGDPAAPKRPGPKRKPVASRIEDIPIAELEKTHYWTKSLPQLRKAYHNICAYLGMRIHEATGLATVDHFEPKSRNKRRAFDWSNFRLASPRMNTNKDDYTDVLDPFEVVDGWFILRISTFAIDVNPAIEVGHLRQRIRETIDRLGLNEPTFCAARREAHDRYHGLVANSRVSSSHPIRSPIWKRITRSSRASYFGRGGFDPKTKVAGHDGHRTSSRKIFEVAHLGRHDVITD